jgi:hypothetical protein
MPDGQHIVIDGTEPGHAPRTYLLDLTGSKPLRPITPERVEANMPSPDGKYIVGGAPPQPGKTRNLTLYAIDGGPSIELPLGATTYGVMQWSADSKALYVYKDGTMPTVIERLDIASGKLFPAREITPADRGGVVSIGPVMCNNTASACAYSDYQTLSVLYVVTGLR